GTPGAPLAEGKKTQPPSALYGLELRVRKADEKEFSDKTKQIPVEVFEDPNTGVLIYVSDAGFIATAPNKKLAEKPGPPTLVKGMNLKVRKAGEEDIEKAAKFGLEVFTDNRTAYLVSICETGSSAVLAKERLENPRDARPGPFSSQIVNPPRPPQRSAPA